MVVNAERQALEDFLESLHAADDGSTCFVVEGKRDVLALVDEGVSCVREIDTSVYLFCERIAKEYERVVILTDLDSEGKKLHAMMKECFSHMGIFVDEKPRELLFKTGLRQVEGLGRYKKRLMGKHD